MEDLRGCGREAVVEAFSLEERAGEEEVRERFEAAHRTSSGSTAIRNLDFCFSHTTSKYNNLINTWVWPQYGLFHW